MGVKSPVNTTTRALGFAVKKVSVEEIIPERNLARCKDSTGSTEEVTLNVRYGKGAWPMVGDVWVIDRSMGPWTFAANVTKATPPVVRGSRTGVPPLVISLIEALGQLGLITDESE